MNNEINLLPGKAKQSSEQRRKREFLHMIAVSSMFIVSFLSIVLFILIALSPLPGLREREKEEMKRLSFYNDMIVKILLTKDRVSQVKKVLKDRPVYSSTIESVKKVLPENAVIEEIHLRDKILSVTITSTSLAPLDRFITALVSTNTKAKKFKNITVTSLLQDFEKDRFVLTMELK